MCVPHAIESTMKDILIVKRSIMRLAFTSNKAVCSDKPITSDSTFNPDKL